MNFDPLGTDKPQHHIRCLPGDVADKVLLPGDPKRAERTAELFDDARHVASNREYATYTGTYRGMPVSVTSTGIGCPSMAIAVEELVSVGARTLIRTGTSGSMTPEVQPGEVIVGTAAIREEGTGIAYLPMEYPAVADLDMTICLRAAARELGLPVRAGVPPGSGPAPGGPGDAGQASRMDSGRGSRVGDGDLHPVYSRVHAALENRLHLHGGKLVRLGHPPDARRCGCTGRQGDHRRARCPGSGRAGCRGRPHRMTARIDVHTHFYPSSYLAALERRRDIPRVYRDGAVRRFVIFPEEHADPRIGRPIEDGWWTVAGKVGFMEENAISQSVISLGNPWLEPFEGQEAIEVAREVNNELGALEEITDGRLVGLGALPATGVDDVLAEIAAIDEHPSLRGIVTGPRITHLQLDDPELESVWDELESRNLPVLLHPQDGIGLDILEGYGHVLPVGVGFPMETTAVVSRLVFGGVLFNHPGLKIIVSHGGGTLSALVGRLDAAWRSDEIGRTRLPEPPSRSIARLYIDAITYAPGPLHASIAMVGQDRIMFGTDHPFSIEDAGAVVGAMDTIDETTQNSIFAGTASALFGLH
ncbi:MAG: amidohydrolase family protein [Acidimicrobiia bacterium]|nr:amidohydrolase family protein [Acidimicrobiia bacterium]